MQMIVKAFIKLSLLGFVMCLMTQCSPAKKVNKKKINEDISAYKEAVSYFMDKNYHNGFGGYIVYDPHNGRDLIMDNFFVNRHISAIYAYGKISPAAQTWYFRDSLICLRFFHQPLFEKAKELIFDFSNQKQIELSNTKGKIQVIEKGIYYVEY